MRKIDQIIASTGQLAPPSDHRGPPLSRLEWEGAVGPRVAARTEPYRLERGVLFVRAATAAWANELSMLSDPILQQLRARGLDVNTVRFNVGRVKPPDPPRGPTATPQSAELPELPAAIEELAQKIGVPELRRAVSQAAARQLAHAGSIVGETTADAQPHAVITSRRARATGGADRAAESPTPPQVSPSPPPTSETRPKTPDRSDR